MDGWQVYGGISTSFGHVEVVLDSSRSASEINMCQQKCLHDFLLIVFIEIVYGKVVFYVFSAVARHMHISPKINYLLANMVTIIPFDKFH